ncbi:hypothetical protein SEA_BRUTONGASTER_82 [Gordonia phage BrutonGaster]|uniref:Uncharacterized protein n=1 Tax=Gordonia phage BrutonGaster TaxID=2530116 RepID=A0A482JLX3_9CAUD|nr:hypothetical protein HOV26_gp100 [Gordonia phage BrutonGaster]QBP33387.1 hypothetical protein SEA_BRUTONGASTER_82 [Gordonia phage BrutonGaster]
MAIRLMSNASQECEFATLFQACNSPAEYEVTYRWWGRKVFCASHFHEMNTDGDRHVLSVAAALTQA